MCVSELLKTLNADNKIEVRMQTKNKIDTVYRGIARDCKYFNDYLVKSLYVFNDNLEIEI